MSERGDRNGNAEQLRADVRQMFPESAFSGSITEGDGLQAEDLDEPRALSDALHGRKWSEVERSVISSFPDGFVLLTDLAFIAFLPAWLIAALDDHKVRELLIFSFSPDVHRTSKGWDPRIGKLTPPQRKTLLAFFRYYLKVESSESVRREIRNAIAFAESLCTAS